MEQATPVKFQLETEPASSRFQPQPDVYSNSITSLYGQTEFASSNARAALVIAHPGHELMIHGWLELARPLVFVLTDGSGRTNRSRLDSTTKILGQAGAKPGCIYGRLSDHAAYAAILDHEFDLFIRLAKELAEALTTGQIDYVAGDAAEGYSPTHDVCRLIINVAVEIANRATARPLGNFAFYLRPRELDCEEPCAEDIYLKLDEKAFARKIARAKGYAGLAAEVSAALNRNPIDAFRAECLHRVDMINENNWDGQRRFYEEYGEQQVAQGYYERVLRYREHIEPLARALALAKLG